MRDELRTLADVVAPQVTQTLATAGPGEVDELCKSLGRAIDVQIVSLHKKLGSCATYIETVRGGRLSFH